MEPQDQAFLESALPFYVQLSKQDRQLLTEHLSKVHYAAGQQLYSGKQDCLGLLLIQSGQLRVYLLSETGKQITLYRLLERDVCIFTASCMMKNISFEVYAQAEQETDALLIPAAIYDHLRHTSLPVADYLTQLMESRFSEVMSVMDRVLFMTFDQRLAAFLLEQCNIEESTVLHLTHEEIAHHLGTLREVVTRKLQTFQEQGLISLTRGHVEILDIKRLSQMW